MFKGKHCILSLICASFHFVVYELACYSYVWRLTPRRFRPLPRDLRSDDDDEQGTTRKHLEIPKSQKNLF